MEKTYLNDLEVVNELINVVPVATTEKNGLNPASDVRKEKMIATTTSRIVYEGASSTAISTSLLISLAAFGGGPMTLFYMAINRSVDILKTPAIILNRIGGASAPTTPRFRSGVTKTPVFSKLYWNARNIRHLYI